MEPGSRPGSVDATVTCLHEIEGEDRQADVQDFSTQPVQRPALEARSADCSDTATALLEDDAPYPLRIWPERVEASGPCFHSSQAKG